MLAITWLTALASVLAASASPPSLAKRDVKAVLAHVIVGNTYNYDIQRWTSDVQLAYSKSIDVFTMNVGRDNWQPDRVKLAYDAALSSAPDFKLMLSFDMTEFPCTSIADGQHLIDTFLAIIKGHPSRYLYDSKMALSTFGGQGCTFGQSNPSIGWQWFLASAGTPIYFIRNFHVDVAELSTTWSWLDGYTMERLAINTPRQDPMVTEETVATIVEIISCIPTDGVSLFRIGIVCQLWRSEAGTIMASHTTFERKYTRRYELSWLDLTQHYALWFKYGIEPKIDQERVYMWARSQPKGADICNTDGIGAVQNADWAEELLYVSSKTGSLSKDQRLSITLL
ncbi:alpha-1,3-glucanase [Ceratobasidium sp. AG-Ba]|nr:alpha-1,3-glucanase [Ceratobasidium sp. AG-Ba]